MSQVDVKLNSGNIPQVDGHCVFGIKRSLAQLSVTFPDGGEFGLLNVHTSKALDSLIDLPSVQLEALADMITLRETIDRATKASDATLRVNINMYGPRETRKDVG